MLPSLIFRECLDLVQKSHTQNNTCLIRETVLLAALSLAHCKRFKYVMCGFFMSLRSSSLYDTLKHKQS